VYPVTEDKNINLLIPFFYRVFSVYGLSILIGTGHHYANYISIEQFVYFCMGEYLINCRNKKKIQVNNKDSLSFLDSNCIVNVIRT